MTHHLAPRTHRSKLDTRCLMLTIDPSESLMPAHGGELASVEKRLGRWFPSEVGPDFGPSRQTDLPAEAPISEQMYDSICKGLRLIRNQNVLAVYDRKTFDTNRG